MTLTAPLIAVPLIAVPVLLGDVVADATIFQVVILFFTGLFALLTAVSKLKFDRDKGRLEDRLADCEADRKSLRDKDEQQQQQINRQQAEGLNLQRQVFQLQAKLDTHERA